MILISARSWLWDTGVVLNLEWGFSADPGQEDPPTLPYESLWLGPSLQPCRVFSALASQRKKENILMRTVIPLVWAAGRQRTFNTLS